MARHRAYMPFNGEQVRQDGITVSCSDGNGRARVLVRSGMPQADALREIAWQLDEWPGEWRIDAISTPRTIYRDLQGSRSRALYAGAAENWEEAVQFPERIALGHIGRLDLLRDA